jgi:ribonuclease HI
MAGSFVLFTDGASRGNPGPAAIGAVLYRRDGERLVRVAELSRAIGRATNNVAEYLAVVDGLEMASAFAPDRLELRADSQLLIRQLEGVYRVKAPGLRDLYERARAGLGAIPDVRLEHVPREENREADALANAALDG